MCIITKDNSMDAGINHPRSQEVNIRVVHIRRGLHFYYMRSYSMNRKPSLDYGSWSVPWRMASRNGRPCRREWVLIEKCVYTIRATRRTSVTIHSTWKWRIWISNTLTGFLYSSSTPTQRHLLCFLLLFSGRVTVAVLRLPEDDSTGSEI